MAMFDPQFNSLTKAMEVATLRQEIISHNIANAKTPGYQAMEFDEELMKAVKRLDQPSVNMEEELAALTENSIKYSSYVKLFSSKINVLKTIASQGKR